MDRMLRMYVRKLEEALARRSEGPRVFTQRDYRLALRWYREGVPAGLIQEILDRRRTGARSLSQIATRVDESWKAVRGGKLRDTEENQSPVPGVKSREAELEVAVTAAPQSSELRDLLERLLLGLRKGDSPEELERMVETALPGAVAKDLFRRAEEDARRSLESHRNRMPPDAFRETVRKGVLARLRRQTGIPRFR